MYFLGLEIKIYSIQKGLLVKKPPPPYWKLNWGENEYSLEPYPFGPWLRLKKNCGDTSDWREMLRLSKLLNALGSSQLFKIMHPWVYIFSALNCLQHLFKCEILKIFCHKGEVNSQRRKSRIAQVSATSHG